MSETRTDTFTTTPVDQARWRTREQILSVARLLDGDAAIVTATTAYGSACPDTAPLAGIRAAMFVRNVAAGRAREYATKARACGISWAEVGDALGLTKVATDAGQLVEEAAWFYLAEGVMPGQDRPNGWRDPSVSWRCVDCSGWVSDHGPFEGHPDDRESGHTETCPRHTAAVTAWRSSWDES